MARTKYIKKTTAPPTELVTSSKFMVIINLVSSHEVNSHEINSNEVNPVRSTSHQINSH